MPKLLNIRGKLLDLSAPAVMGILNLTPDSFYDGGFYQGDAAILKRVEQMRKEGVDILDLGAGSSRPGAGEISEEEELTRLLKPLEAIQRFFPDLPVSVDTFRSRVASEAADRGASIINDISAGEADTEMIRLVASKKLIYIGMHRQGNSASMQINPRYNHVVHEVLGYFAGKLCGWRSAGIHDIIIDPGFGFGKDLGHNYSLLKGLGQFKIFEMPILVGLSRKSMICKALKVNPDKALNGSSAAHMLALIGGADILRVHDVREAKEVSAIFSNYERAIL